MPSGGSLRFRYRTRKACFRTRKRIPLTVATRLLPCRRHFNPTTVALTCSSAASYRKKDCCQSTAIFNFVEVAHARQSPASSSLRSLNRNFLSIFDIDASCGVRYGAAHKVVVIARVCLGNRFNATVRVSSLVPLV